MGVTCAEVKVDDPSLGPHLGDSPLGSHIDYSLLGIMRPTVDGELSLVTWGT